MALSTTILDSRLNDQTVNDTVANNTGPNNALGFATTVHFINAASAAAEINYLKIYNAKSGVATADPDIIIPVPITGTVWVSMPSGVTLSTGLSFRCVQEPGSSGVTNPGVAVNVHIVAT